MSTNTRAATVSASLYKDLESVLYLSKELKSVFYLSKKLTYIALEVTPHSRSYDTPFKLKAHSLYTTIINKIEQLYGDFGVAALKGGFIAKYCNEKTRVAFVRARHGPHRLLASCLPLITYIENHQVMLRILYTGATMRQCYKFIQKYQRSQLQRFWANLKTDKQRKAMEDAVMNLKTTEVPSKD
uniref:Uncharacterized protein n=1 Tax=Timema cristinae TaxID=61476 RepID=A0A7R9CBW4_TIMCR|nr:unnamed protein product [Timema cristinae]